MDVGQQDSTGLHGRIIRPLEPDEAGPAEGWAFRKFVTRRGDVITEHNQLEVLLNQFRIGWLQLGGNKALQFMVFLEPGDEEAALEAVSRLEGVDWVPAVYKPKGIAPRK